MAVTTITASQLTSDTAFVVTAGIGTAINTANSMTVAYPKDGQLLIYIDSNHADTAATVAAGFGVDAQTTTYTVGDTVASMFVVGASAKNKATDGFIDITWATNSAGFLAAFLLPASNT